MVEILLGELWELYIVTDGVIFVILLGEAWDLYIVTDGVIIGILLGEFWELYIVTDSVMVGILLGEELELYILTDGVIFVIFSRPLCCLSKSTAVNLFCFSRLWSPSQHFHNGHPDYIILK
jgi:hypothetical protein